jgi:oligoendopeptidase F
MSTETKQVLKRSELPVQYTWDLATVYPDESMWEADFQAVKDAIPGLESFQGSLAGSPERLLACLRLRDETQQRMDQLFVYARMRRDEDNANNRYQAMTDRATALAAQMGSATAFLSPEILSMPDDQLRSALEREPGLELYGHFLEEVQRQRAHVRSAEVETVLAQAADVTRTPDTTYSMLTNADMKFPTILDEEGRRVELSQGRYSQLRESRDRRVRRDAFEGLHGVYDGFRNTMAASLAGSIRSDIFYARARNYPTAMEAALNANNIPTAVYSNLIHTVRRNLPTLHRYAALRKRLLGLDELHHYDLYVPMVPNVQVTMSYEEATQKVLEALAPMGGEYLDTVKTAFSSRWIDVLENEGKTSGAYSDGAYTTRPFILLNFQGTLTDVFTLAHEMGHSMHSHFTRTTQPFVYGDYTIFLAEVASTLNESLLSTHLIRETTDPRLRAHLINQYMERFRTTLFRQTMFAEFELETHTRAEAGEALTSDQLSEIYRELNSAYYGPGVANHEEIAIEWARIPHFYWAFYVYQYATGISAAASLAHQIQAEGEPAVQRYIRFLRSGSSDYSINLLRDAGVDMTSPEPVQQAIDLFEGLLTELEQVDPSIWES